MNLTTLKAQAEAARADSVELELWRESIEVDEYLRLVEVARYAIELQNIEVYGRPKPRALLRAKMLLTTVLEGIEP